MEYSKQSRLVCSHFPITPSILRILRLIWIKDSERIPFNNIMLWAACLVTFFFFCCSGEVIVERENHCDASVHLSYSDLAVDNPANPSVISMLIKKSKTDQGRRGAKIYL